MVEVLLSPRAPPAGCVSLVSTGCCSFTQTQFWASVQTLFALHSRLRPFLSFDLPCSVPFYVLSLWTSPTHFYSYGFPLLFPSSFAFPLTGSLFNLEAFCLVLFFCMLLYQVKKHEFCTSKINRSFLLFMYFYVAIQGWLNSCTLTVQTFTRQIYLCVWETYCTCWFVLLLTFLFLKT